MKARNNTSINDPGLFSPHDLIHPCRRLPRRWLHDYSVRLELMVFNSAKKGDEKSSPGRRKVLGAKARDRRVQVVRVLLEGSFQQKLGLRDMSAKVNLSPWRLAHLFKAETGMSPQRYLTLVRLQRARNQLETSFLSVQKIGAAVGISNPSQFTKSFKAAYGMTPVEYRKVHLRILPEKENTRGPRSSE